MTKAVTGEYRRFIPVGDTKEMDKLNALVEVQNEQVVTDSRKVAEVFGKRTDHVMRDIDMGQKRLFQWLRDNGYLMKSGSSKNMPTQRAMEMKLFEIKEGSYINGDGVNVITKTSKVTGKGQIYFVNKLLAKPVKTLLN